ncbi:MAG: GNAT family N-acetyltransferase [Patescibacteria group bacterium]
MRDIVIKRIDVTTQAFFKATRSMLAELYPGQPQLDRVSFDRVMADGGVELHIACVDNVTAGMASLVHVRKLGGHVCMIEDVFVLPAFRSFGVGSALNEVLCQLAKKYGSSFVDVLTRRPDARAFYLRCGFEDKDKNRPHFALRRYL